MRGWQALSQWWELTAKQTRENNQATRELFEKALAIDANGADALVGDAATYDIDRQWG